ncbi:MAG: hypothetical protein ACO2O6_02070, partial [Candidatus Hydrothermia bacterium]
MIILLLLGQSLNEQRLIRIEDRINALETRVARIEERLNGIEKRIDDLDKKLNSQIDSTNKRIDDFISFMWILASVLIAMATLNLGLVIYLIYLIIKM